MEEKKEMGEQVTILSPGSQKLLKDMLEASKHIQTNVARIAALMMPPIPEEALEATEEAVNQAGSSATSPENQSAEKPLAIEKATTELQHLLISLNKDFVESLILPTEIDFVDSALKRNVFFSGLFKFQSSLNNFMVNFHSLINSITKNEAEESIERKLIDFLGQITSQENFAKNLTIHLPILYRYIKALQERLSSLSMLSANQRAEPSLKTPLIQCNFLLENIQGVFKEFFADNNLSSTEIVGLIDKTVSALVQDRKYLYGNPTLKILAKMFIEEDIDHKGMDQRLAAILAYPQTKYILLNTIYSYYFNHTRFYAGKKNWLIGAEIKDCSSMAEVLIWFIENYKEALPFKIKDFKDEQIKAIDKMLNFLEVKCLDIQIVGELPNRKFYDQNPIEQGIKWQNFLTVIAKSQVKTLNFVFLNPRTTNSSFIILKPVWMAIFNSLPKTLLENLSLDIPQLLNLNRDPDYWAALCKAIGDSKTLKFLEIKDSVLKAKNYTRELPNLSEEETHLLVDVLEKTGISTFQIDRKLVYEPSIETFKKLNKTSSSSDSGHYGTLFYRKARSQAEDCEEFIEGHFPGTPSNPLK